MTFGAKPNSLQPVIDRFFCFSFFDFVYFSCKSKFCIKKKQNFDLQEEPLRFPINFFSSVCV